MTALMNLGYRLTVCRWAFPGALVGLSLTALAAGGRGPSSSISAFELGPGITNHPVCVIASEAITLPSGWPVDDRGAITCLTCHTQIPNGLEESGSRLREFDSGIASPAAFCARCHDQVSGGGAKSAHWLAIGVAHVRDDQWSGGADSGILDGHSRQCLSCHDGATASDSKNITPRTIVRGFLGDKRRNHPVGVRYHNPSRSKDLSPLRPVGMLPRRVALPDGKVGCVSCHNLYAGTQDLLTVPIRGSELCLTCHDMS